jgi:IS30 family transposase
VSGWLGRKEGMSFSKSTIYNWISATSPYHKDNICKHLRHGGRKTVLFFRRGTAPIPGLTSIDDRLVEANGRTIGD